jgi:hypothetical protein
VSARRLTFYQQAPRDLPPRVEDEIRIGDLSLYVYRFGGGELAPGVRTPINEHVSVKVAVFTDSMATWRRLDRMRVFHKIERAQLATSDDLARLLASCGLRHIPHPGSEYEPDGGEAESARIERIHARVSA